MTRPKWWTKQRRQSSVTMYAAMQGKSMVLFISNGSVRLNLLYLHPHKVTEVLD